MRPSQRTKIARRGTSSGAVLLCLLGCAGGAKAQSVLAPSAPSPISLTPPAVMEEQEEAGTLLPGLLSKLPGINDLLQIGPVGVHPHVSYGLSYGGGIQSAPGQQQSSLIQTLTPGVTLILGTHWTADYTPSLTYYSDAQFHNTVNQSASVSWGSSYEDWTMGFSQSYSATDDPLVQTGTQTATQSYGTSVNASYRFNSFMSLDMSASQSISEASDASLQNSTSWSTMEYLNYQIWPRLTAGLGLGGGYTSVNVGPNLSNEELQGRISWQVFNKLSLTVNGGLEDQQYLGGGIPDTITPVFGVSFGYVPVENTSLSLNASRTVSPSIFQEQVTTSTTVSLGLSQRLLKKFSLNLGAGYGLTSYSSAASTVSTDREDTSYSFNAGLSWALFKRASASLFYQYSENLSNGQGLGYSSSQEGLQLSYAF